MQPHSVNTQSKEKQSYEYVVTPGKYLRTTGGSRGGRDSLRTDDKTHPAAERQEQETSPVCNRGKPELSRKVKEMLTPVSVEVTSPDV